MFDYQYHDHKLYNKTICCKIKLTVQCRPLLSWHLTIIIYKFRALKSHALSVSLMHFDAISRSHADTSISYALTLFSKVTLPFKLSEVLMNSECAPSLALNFG